MDFGQRRHTGERRFITAIRYIRNLRQIELLDLVASVKYAIAAVAADDLQARELKCSQ